MITGVPTATNTTTFIDALGVYVGLERFTGETSDRFYERIRRAAALDRGPGYYGFLNELSLQFAAPARKAFIAAGPERFDLSCSVSGLKLSSAEGSLTVPLLAFDGDGAWVWRKISDIVAEINQSPVYYADLTGEDGPALQLVRQSNVRAATGEEISGTSVKLSNPLVPGSEMFTVAVPGYAVSADGLTLSFNGPVPAGTRMSYLYRICPYPVIAFPAAVLSLLDPDLPDAAAGPTGALSYQVREYLQALIERDRSYWSL